MLKLLATTAIGALALGAALSITPAKADMRAYYKSGGWTNSAGTNDSGTLMCNMDTGTSDRRVYIKFSEGNLFVHIFKTTWRIPDGTKIKVELGFDKDVWGNTDSAYGHSMKGGRSSGIVINIEPDSVRGFLEEVASSEKMWLRFGGSEQPWSVNMTGSRDAVKSFESCMGKIIKSQPSQPFTSGDQSQPFDTPSSDKFEKKPDPFAPKQTDRGA